MGEALHALSSKGSRTHERLCFSKPNLLQWTAKTIERRTIRGRSNNPGKTGSPSELPDPPRHSVSGFLCVHAPFQRRGLGDADWEVWAAMEELYESAKTKMIGISNVAADQLEELCDNANHKPMVVQNRCFAALGWDKQVRDICQAHGIIYQGFSLLTANRAVLVDPEIRAIARRLGAAIAR